MFGNVEGQKHPLFEKLKELEGVEEVREVSEEERACKVQVSVELERVSLLEEMF